MDLKYLVSSQVVDVQYEGHTRRFAVSSISGQKKAAGYSVSELADQFDNLTVGTEPSLWVVGWDTTVVVEDPQDEKKLEHKVALSD